MWDVKESGIKSDSTDVGLSGWKDGVTTKMGKIMESQVCGMEGKIGILFDAN